MRDALLAMTEKSRHHMRPDTRALVLKNAGTAERRRIHERRPAAEAGLSY
jgi:hypothetical protein